MIFFDTDTTVIENAAAEAAQEASEQVGMIEEYLGKIADWCMSKAGSVIVAAIFMFVCFKLVKLLLKILKKSFEKSKLETSVAGFFLSAIRITLNFLIILTAATIVGFQITSFITILGTAGVTVGLALQGSLSNLAGGLLILILKPFRVGDYIVENATGCEGTVVAIDIFYTHLLTVDNKSVVIPNGNISNTSLVNVTQHDKRGVDIDVSVAYDSDMDKVKEAAETAARKAPGFLPDENVVFYIDKFGDSGIAVHLRFYVRMEDYFQALWDTRWNLKKEFDAQGIVIPYNRVDVTVKQEV